MAVIALPIAIVIAVLLAQVVVRPIHVIRSGLTRLGRGDLGATLDLKGDEFKELGDVFASVTNQLKAAIPDGAKRVQLVELSRRVTALGRLTAGVAHEVKNPLNAMTIHLELLKQKLAAGAGPEAMESHVDVIAREIRRLDDVVQGFLKFARPEELTLRPVSPGELADEVLQTLAVEANVSRVELEAAIAPDVPQIEADAGILRQALLNLAKNAVQAMPDGGRLTIACASTKDGRVEIRVSDTGVGIAPENLAPHLRPVFHDQAHRHRHRPVARLPDGAAPQRRHRRRIDARRGNDVHHQDAACGPRDAGRSDAVVAARRIPTATPLLMMRSGR